MTTRILKALFFIMLTLPLFLSAQDKEEKKTSDDPRGGPGNLSGEEVMTKVRENEYSESMDAVIQMTLVDKNGKTQVRRFKLQRSEEDVLIRFLYPPDIKDTGYLILDDKNDETQVYIYFPPPTDDYRQINVEEDGTTQSFLGSDFDITDFQVRDPEDTKNEFLRMEKIAGIDCYVIESIPVDPEYKYSRIVSWIRSDYFLPIRIMFYDRKGELVKDMKVFKFKAIGDRKVISKSEMSNLANDHKTILELEEIQFDITFPDNNFTIRRLTQP